MNKRGRGFTLIELLVALAVFAILAAMAYGGLNSVLHVRRETERQAARLAELQSALVLMERDLSQIYPRETRDEYGDAKPALRGGALSPMPLEFTRGGWRNPAAQTRSSLQRIAYALDDGTLIRHGWRVLDRAQDSAAYPARVLTGVRTFKARFLDPSRQWTEDWPPLQTTAEPAGPAPLPLAVEVVLELDDLGTIKRLMRVPEGWR